MESEKRPLDVQQESKINLKQSETEVSLEDATDQPAEVDASSMVSNEPSQEIRQAGDGKAGQSAALERRSEFDEKSLVKSEPARRRPYTWTLRYLLPIFLVIVLVEVWLVPFMKHVSWSTALTNYQLSLSSPDTKRPIRIAEQLLQLNDKDHERLLLALAAEAYWNNGDDAKAADILTRDIELCKQSQCPLSALEANSVLLSERLRSGNRQAALEAVKQGCELAASINEQNLSGLDKRLLEDLAAHRSFDPSPVIHDAGHVHWRLRAPSDSILHNCELLDQYGDFAGLKYLSTYMIEHASDYKLSEDSRTEFLAYSAIASYELGDMERANTSTNLVLKEKVPSLENLPDPEINCFSRLAAECMAHGNSKQAQALFRQIDSLGVAAFASINARDSQLLAEITIRAFESGSFYVPVGCGQAATAMAWKHQYEPMDKMFQRLISATERPGRKGDQAWLGMNAMYIEYLTRTEQSRLAHQSRQQVIDKVTELLASQKNDEPNIPISDCLGEVTESALTEDDPDQAANAALLRKKVDELSQYEADLTIALIPAYKGRASESTMLVSKALQDIPKGMEPDEIAAHAALGKVYFLLDRRSKAVEEFEQAIKQAEKYNSIDPDSLSYLNMNLALVYNNAGRRKDALERMGRVAGSRRLLSASANSYFEALLKTFPEVKHGLPECVLPCDSAVNVAPSWKAVHLPAIVTSLRYTPGTWNH